MSRNYAIVHNDYCLCNYCCNFLINVDSSPGVNDRDGCSPLEAALIWLYNFEGCNDAAICLINRGCGGDKQKAQLLYGACLWGRLDIVKELVELHNLNPNRKWLVLYCEGV